MTAGRDSTKTLEQACAVMSACAYKKDADGLVEAWQVIKAHLSRKVSVSDAMLQKACDAYADELRRQSGTSEYFPDGMRAALESFAASLPVARVDEPLKVFSDGEWTYGETGQVFKASDMDEAAFVVYREALLAQAPAGVRDGLTALTFGGWCNTLTHAYMYITEHQHGNAQYGIKVVLDELREWQRKLNAAPSDGEGDCGIPYAYASVTEDPDGPNFPKEVRLFFDESSAQSHARRWPKNNLLRDKPGFVIPLYTARDGEGE